MEGYTFMGWTGSCGSTPQKNVTLSNGTTGNKGYTANWTKNKVYTITYVGNGSTSGVMEDTTLIYGDDATALRKNEYARTGYLFKGWATMPTGTVKYQDEEKVRNLSFINNDQIKLFAVWEPIKYTIEYNGNGATSGSTANSRHTYDLAQTLSANGYLRTGYTFKGWSLSASGEKAYNDKQEVINLTTENEATLIFYAVWVDDIPPIMKVTPPSGGVIKNRKIIIKTEDLGSGVSNSNDFQYYLSNKENELSGGAWITYTNGQETTIGTDLTGTYYLFVKRIKDNAGNYNVSEGTATAISGTTYQRFGTYVFDNQAPGTFTITNSSNGNWTNKDISLNFKATDNTAVDHFEVKQDDGTWKNIATAVNGEATIIFTAEMDKEFTYRAVDTVGNISVEVSTKIRIDKTNPTKPTYEAYYSDGSGAYTSGNWTNKEVKTKIITTDDASGAYQIQYSADKATWTTFTFNPSNGIVKDGSTYYGIENWTLNNRNDIRYFKVIDTAGNESEISDVFNIKYDINKPTITATPSIQTTAVKNINVVLKVEDTGNSGLSSSNIYQYQIGTSDQILPTGTWLTYTSGQTITIGTTLTNTYYLWVREVKDNAGNTSLEQGTKNGLYHVFGKYVFDNSAPTVKFETNGNTTYSKSQSTNVTVSDGNSGVDNTSLKYQWTQSTTPPTEASFSNSFTSGGTISKSDGTGNNWYLWILAKDNVKNTTIINSNPFYLDNTNPTASINVSTTNLTNQDIILTVNANDSNSGLTTIKFINTSTIVDMSGKTSSTFSISTNGTYNFEVSDNVGNKTTVTQTVNNIDKLAPSSVGTGNITATTTSITIAVAGASDAEATTSYASSGIQNYDFYLDGVKKVTQSGATYTYTGLTPNTSHSITWVIRDNAQNTTTASTVSKYTLANVPTSLLATGGVTAQGQQITVNWSANGNAGTPTYELQVSTDGTNFTTLYTGTGLTYTHTGLGIGNNDGGNMITRYYRIRATNGDGIYTAYTSNVAGNTMASPTVTKSVTSNGVNSGTNNVSLSWGAVSGATSYVISIFDGYDYRYRNIGNVTSWNSNNANIYPTSSQISAWGTKSTDPFRWGGDGTDFSSSFNNLYVSANNGYTTYSYYTWIHLIAVDSAGRWSGGVWTGATSECGATIDNDAPNQFTPTTTSTTNSITVSGSTTDKYMTSNYPGSGIRGYTFSRDNGSNWTSEQSGTSYTFTGLTHNTTYNLKMRAYDNNGNYVETSTVNQATIRLTAGSLSMKLNNSSGGTYTNGTWSNQNIYVSANEGNAGTTTYASVSGSAQSISATSGATTVSAEGTTNLLVTTTDGTNTINGATYTIKIDKTSPNITTSQQSNINASFSNWTLGGSAYIDGNGNLVMPDTSASAISPFLPIDEQTWIYEADAYTATATPQHTPNGGNLMGQSYYDSNFQSIVAPSNNYSGNGYSTTIPLNSTMHITINASSGYGYGAGVKYVRFSASVDNYWSTGPVTYSNSKLTAYGTSNKSKTINTNVSDSLSGVAQTKWLSGTRSASEVASSGTVFSGSFEVTANGTYTILAIDNAGNQSTKVESISGIDSTAPTILAVNAGAMVNTDPTFASGYNGISTYNNSGGGTVSVTRGAMTTPTGSGYGLTIQTTGTSSPGWGGFYFATPTSANKTFISRIIAKLPVGYTINWASNAYGSGSTTEWLSSQAGTGDWAEYIFKVSCGSSGTFSSTNFFYLTGGNTPTASSPLTWYVAYATVYDTTKWGQSNTAIFKATDSDSGIVGYGINQSSTGAPAYTTCTSKSSIATQIENITVNGTYYLWVIDAVGNQSKQAFTVAYIDRTAPSKTTVNLNGYTSGSWTNSNVNQTFTATDSQSGIAYYQYSNDGVNVASNLSSSWTINWDGEWNFYIRAVDNAGNVGPWSDMYTIRRDTVAPTLNNIRAVSSVGYYKSGTTITIATTWSDTLSTGSIPTLTLNFGGGTTRTATYSNVSGNTINYTYTVQSGDNGTLAIVGYSGTVYDKAGNAGSATTLSNTGNVIVADTILPVWVTPSIVLSSTSGVLSSGKSTTITITGENYGTLSCTTSNSSIATASIINSSGYKLQVNAVAQGTATITINGSTGGKTTYTIIVDSTAPTIVKNGPASSSIIGTKPYSIGMAFVVNDTGGSGLTSVPTADNITIKIGSTVIYPIKTLTYDSSINGYVLSISGITTLSGTLTYTISAGTAIDSAGNSNSETTISPGITAYGNAKIYYQIHVSNNGWTGTWQSQGVQAVSGSGGIPYQIEAIKIYATGLPSGTNLNAQAHVANIGWMTTQTMGNGSTSSYLTIGTTGQGKAIEALKIGIDNYSEYFDIWTSVFQNGGFQNLAGNNVQAGTTGNSWPIYALKVNL